MWPFVETHSTFRLSLWLSVVMRYLPLVLVIVECSQTLVFECGRRCQQMHQVSMASQHGRSTLLLNPDGSTREPGGEEIDSDGAASLSGPGTKNDRHVAVDSRFAAPDPKESVSQGLASKSSGGNSETSDVTRRYPTRDHQRSVDRSISVCGGGRLSQAIRSGHSRSGGNSQSRELATRL